MKEFARLPNCALRVSVIFDRVTITLGASSEYEARVLYEDIVERLQAGQKISLECSHFKKDA